MKLFILTLPRNILGSFKGWKILWHLLAIVFTIILVKTNADWLYFKSTRNPELFHAMFFAAIIGQLVPMTLPWLLLLIGRMINSVAARNAGWAIGQAVLLGWFISSCYKSITGRVHPSIGLAMDSHHVAIINTSHVFRFGFMRGGIFWGWPSSHTATAFAMAVAIFTLFPHRRGLGIIAILYAFYIGIGVSMTIHWLSDFVAGAMIGTAIGRTVGSSFFTASPGPNSESDTQTPPPGTSAHNI
jgi:membrane-associated phospholipid phosphatase